MFRRASIIKLFVKTTNCQINEICKNDEETKDPIYARLRRRHLNPES